MVVTATCTDCAHENLLGERTLDGGTTTCPSCGSHSYVASSDGTVSKPEDERIREAISDVRGVGDETLEHIIKRYTLYVELEQASVDELTDVQNVGERTAERVIEATSRN